MRFSKNASLNLSINAIVILILAITMLGLGLGFMRNIFGQATEEFTKVGGTVQKQMIDQMKETNKIVDIDRPKVSIKKAGKDQVYIGFKNVQASDMYFGVLNPDLRGMNFKSTLGVATGQTCDPDLTKWCTGSEQSVKNTCCCLELAYKTSTTKVTSGEVMVLPINVKSHSSAPEGTCFYDLVVCEGSSAFTLAGKEIACPGATTENHLELTVDVTV